MKSRKLALLLTLAIAAQTALAPVSSMSTVYAAPADQTVTEEADNAVTDSSESSEEVASSSAETVEENSSVSESEEQTLNDESSENVESSEETAETKDENTTEEESITEVETGKSVSANSVSANKAELIGDVSFPSDAITSGVEVASYDTLYQNYKQSNYSIPFAIKTQNVADETWDSSHDVDIEDIRLDIDGKVLSAKHVYSYASYFDKYIVLGPTIPDSSISAGKHKVKVAIKRGEQWYAGSFETTFVKPNIKDQKFELNADGAEPKAKNYFSAKKGGIIADFNTTLISDSVPLNSQGHQLKSFSLVKHGTNTSVKIKAKIKSTGVGAIFTSPYYNKYKYDYDYRSMEAYLSNVIPAKETCMTVLASINIDEDIDEGWYDIVVVADSGSKATYYNAYYATNKTVLFDMGYILPWYYGEPIYDASGDYVAAYIYGVNISDSVYPTYFDADKQMTGNVVNKESLLCNAGYNYQLEKTNKDIWDSYIGAPELTLKSNLGEDIIDLREEDSKNKPILTPYGITFPKWNTAVMYANSDLNKLGFNGETTFAIYGLKSLTPLVTGKVDTNKCVDDLVPAKDKYKFNYSDYYRVVGYNSYGTVISKEYYNRFTTGQPNADSVTISVEPSEATVGVGGTVKLVPTVGPDVIADKSVTYSSNKKTVATVDAEGTVTGVAPGTAEITVTTKTGGKKAKVKIIVIEKIVAVTGITISEQDKEISGVTGDYYPLSYTLAPEDVTETDVEFVSDNEDVVKTNAEDGMLYMVGPGEANITVKITSPSTGETFSDTCKVTVTKKPVKATSVSLNCRNVVLKPGDGPFRLYASVNPSDADVKSVTWNYNKNGVISRMTEYPLSAVIYPNYIRGGDAIVWIEHSDGLTAECKVTVLKDEALANGDNKPDDEKHDIWISTIPDQTYTGSKITPEIRVYDGNVMLTKGTDYTVTYANNVNVGSIGATDKNGKNIAPRAVVKFKGNYKGISLSRSFNILPLNIETNTDSDFFDVSDITIDFKDGKTYKPIPVLKRNGKKLKAGKDFDYEYKFEGTTIDKITDNNRYTIEITAKGNYTGKKNIHCDAIGRGGVYVSISDITVKVDPSSYEYDPAGVTPTYTVTYGGEPVDPKMYTVTYLNDSNSRVGTATMVFKGSGEYDMYEFVGEKRVTFKITGKALDKAVNVEGIVNKTFTGSDIMQDDAKLTHKTDPSKVLEKDKDYTVSYTKNINVGTATVTYKGIGAYTGTLKKTFKINKANADDIEVNVYDVPYTKGGAKTDPSVKYNGRKLTSGKDYTLSYKYNTVVTTEGVRNKPEITIKYKGNFSGQKTYNYKVAGQNINKLNVSVSDKAYSTKAYSWMSAPVITDVNGKKLKAGVDYEKITVGNYDYYGKNWGENPQPGTRITVTVKGKGNYTGEREVDYHIFSNNISKAKFKIKDRIYAGNYVTLSKEDFTTATLTVKENGKKVTKDLELNKDFEIVSYDKNLKKGTATVYIKGIGGEYDLGGTRKLTFKITAKDSATLSYVEEWF